MNFAQRKARSRVEESGATQSIAVQNGDLTTLVLQVPPATTAH